MTTDRWNIIDKYPPLENSIIKMDDKTIYVRQPSMPSGRLKLSSLRGKMSKQTEQEVDDQIESLRDEWDR